MFGIAPGKAGRAHVVAYELFVGPVPEGLMVCHSCDNPPCVRPGHLFLGSNRANLVDASQKGRLGRLRGEAHHQAKLTTEQVIAIRRLYDSGQNLTWIGEQYGVTASQICAIGKRQSWRHVL